MMKVDKEKCLHCGGCIPVCPLNANEFKDPEIVFKENCIECGLCARICPVGAISKEKDEK